MKWLQSFLLWLIPEDMKKGCGVDLFSTGEDPLAPACDLHDAGYDEHKGPVVKYDREFMAKMLEITAGIMKESLNRGTVVLLRVCLYILLARAFGPLLYWRLGAKSS